jgi:hypothetical protein
MKNVRAFFEEYAIASLHGKPKDVALYYSNNFMVATKQEAKSFVNDEKFLEWLEGIFTFNKKSGLQEMKVIEVSSTDIGQYHINATVTWGAKFLKKPDEQIQFDIHYLLNCFDEQFKIILYISEEDQEELMASKGLL